MRYKGRRSSSNVEDRRGMSRGKLAVGGGIGGAIMIVLYLLLGGDPSAVIDQAGQDQNSASGTYEPTAEEQELYELVTVTLADTEDVWQEIFRERGSTYEEPNMVVFTDAVQSACGTAESATGPFYCPADRKIYIDLSFYNQLRQLEAPGDFAMAYVVAHEVGHHVQNLLGISEQVQSQRRSLSEQEYNQLSVRLELQADYFAGLWAHHAQDKFNILQEGDIEEALNAANAIGDDRLQRRSQGYVVPDAFTHGTSAQRVRWFRKGFESGKLEEGDTFNTTNL
ncbi:neutral zinc metallopeptidase [Cesiribacter sp. SM1]|uniref:KPN_02809 family neutral zinc metallopeptidase n=1 Tax=Cesiribacter sp. SM1 TaxID=2861196 RepID=UPI001CD5DB79|nr:neutral zinc metallopeptidase [Cesiribacter sp. SM1]